MWEFLNTDPSLSFSMVLCWGSLCEDQIGIFVVGRLGYICGID